MKFSTDEIIRFCSARIKTGETKIPIGSGVLIRQETLEDKVYLLTSAHCLKGDGGVLLDSLMVDIYNPSSGNYNEIMIEGLVENSVLLDEKERDLAIVIISLDEIKKISPNLPSLPLVYDTDFCSNYICSGFPRANDENYDQTNAHWICRDVNSHTISLNLTNEYIEEYAHGFSGGGIFCVTHNEALLVGVMNRFRLEERGRFMYGQDLYGLAEKLKATRLSVPLFSYVIAEGVTEKCISEALTTTYANLGERFMPTFNVDVAAQNRLEIVARTPLFVDKVCQRFDRWLENGKTLARSSSSYEKEILAIRKEILQELEGLRTDALREMDFAEPLQLAEKLKSRVSADDNKTIEEYIEKHGKYDDTLYSNRQDYSHTYRFCDELNELVRSLFLNAANSNFVVVHGEAGCGKSHLLGWFSLETQMQRCPGLLLLGSSFSSSETIENNILRMLNALCSFDEFLRGLEKIGKRQNRRIPIMIDALNEMHPMNYWKDRLPGFVQKIRQYPYLALIVSIRDTYIDSVIKEEYREEWKLEMCKHDGFSDDENRAVDLFCDYYHLTTLNIQVLNPEFSNPLYLHIACKMAVASGQNSLTADFSNIYHLFEQYVKTLDREFGDKQSRYENRHVVTKGVQCIAEKLLELENEYIPMEKCYELFDQRFPTFPELLTDLLKSSLLSKEISYDDNEYIRFTYQRMGDYYVAMYLIGNGSSAERLERLSMCSGVFNKKYSMSGVLEQLFVLIPEELDVEVWEVLNLKYKSVAVDMLLESLRWRSAKHIHEDKIICFLKENNCSLEKWYRTLIFLSPIPQHPFNAERWHRIMMNYGTMPSRDAVLQMFILNVTRWDKSNDIYRLINWAWRPGISDKTAPEVARLVALTLVWMLSSTIHQIRDQITKALVNLLQHQPHTLLNLLKEMTDVDDMYIKERLLAVAYGCVLRCNDTDTIQEIGQYVYDTTFADMNPPKHLLLRDYACGIVEYAVKKCRLKVDLSLALPPYHAKMPSLPTKEDVEKYRLDLSDKNDRYAHEHNEVLYSLYDGIADFGTKILDTSIDCFLPLNFNTEDDFRNLISRYPGDKGEYIRQYVSIKAKMIQMERKYMSYEGISESYTQLQNGLIAILETIIKDILTDEEYQLVKNEYAPNHARLSLSRYQDRRDTYPYRYWIVKRVFELGYDRNKHGEYDRIIKDVDFRSQMSNIGDGRKERVGKKYEWIAYWELMGCFADNYYIENPWNTSIHMPYDGPWHNYWRDCDPACITRRSEDVHINTWKDYSIISDWDEPARDWLMRKMAIEEIRKMIERVDTNGNKWYTIHDYQNIHAPKKLGDSRYEYSRFYIHDICGFLIHKGDKASILRNEAKTNFLEKEKVSAMDSSCSYITREKYWSRSVLVDNDVSSKLWSPLYDGSYTEVMVPYVAMNGNIEDDCSGTRAAYMMPIQHLFEELNLNYADMDGDFVRGSEMVATCNPNRTTHFLMQGQLLRKYLDENQLDIIWIVQNERYHSVAGDSFMGSEVYQHSGLFYLDENGTIQGKMNVKKR